MDIIKDIIYPVLDMLKDEDDLTFENKPDLKLFGEGAAMDSLLIVRFIIGVENKVQEVAGKKISLAGSADLLSAESPFETVESFAAYLSKVM